MPGRVVRILAKKGDVVVAGQPLLVIEAMKMETRVSAPPGSWRVAKIFVAEGRQVSRDEELIELAPRPKAGELSGGGDDR
jgi:biotin carboxyl carrier protein